MAGVLRQTQDLPAVLQAIVTVDAWNELSVLQQAPWLGRLLDAAAPALALLPPADVVTSPLDLSMSISRAVSA